MIRSVMVINTQGKPRLAKFYDFQPVEKQQELIRSIFGELRISENELAMLDLIQVFVETLDKCFKNVCELDIVYNYSKINTILDEIVFGGQVLETSSTEVMKAVEEISKLEAASNAIALVSKSVSSWRSR